MSSLLNYLRSIDTDTFVSKIQKKEYLTQLIDKFDLDNTKTIDGFAEFMLIETRKTINAGNRTDGTKILKYVKALFPFISEEMHVSFYLALADSFLVANDYTGAFKAASKAKIIANNAQNPKLEIKALNLLFIIQRTLGKDKAINYLLKSKKLSIEVEDHENIVFCDVNIGLIHLFNKNNKKAAEYVKRVINHLTVYPYPEEKINMPADFYIQVFTENPGYITAPIYKETVRNGVEVVLRAVKHIENIQQASRRISLLISTLKLSDEILTRTLKIIERGLEEISKEKRSSYYMAIASGLGDYKDYKLALVFLEKAINHLEHVKDEETHRKVRKNYGYTISRVLNATMAYDLQSSSNLINQSRTISIETEENSLIGKRATKISFRNSPYDSDSVYGISRSHIVNQIIPSIKEVYEWKPIINKLRISHSKKDPISEVELIVINAKGQDDDIRSLLLIGTVLDEKGLRKKRRVFTGFQIVGHIVPNQILQENHFEEYDIKFIYDLIYAPQKFKEIELLTNSKNLDLNFESIGNEIKKG